MCLQIDPISQTHTSYTCNFKETRAFSFSDHFCNRLSPIFMHKDVNVFWEMLKQSLDFSSLRPRFFVFKVLAFLKQKFHHFLKFAMPFYHLLLDNEWKKFTKI